jgi:hypothetical protein
MRSHHAKNILRITSKQTIGTVDDCVIGQNLTRFFGRCAKGPVSFGDAMTSVQNAAKPCLGGLAALGGPQAQEGCFKCVASLPNCHVALDSTPLRRYQPHS